MASKFNKIICIDLESTCYENDVWPEGEKQDIIEIGVAVLHTDNWKITDNRGILIRPTRSKVSEFCTKLTTLTYEKLRTEGSPNFEQGLKRFVNEYGPKNYPWASWGNWDRWAFSRQCDDLSLSYPFGSNHFNVKALWSCWKGGNTGIGYLGDVVRHEGLPDDGTPHRGDTDARWCAEILGKILKGH